MGWEKEEGRAKPTFRPAKHRFRAGHLADPNADRRLKKQSAHSAKIACAGVFDTVSQMFESRMIPPAIGATFSHQKSLAGPHLFGNRFVLPRSPPQGRSSRASCRNQLTPMGAYHRAGRRDTRIGGHLDGPHRAPPRIVPLIGVEFQVTEPEESVSVRVTCPPTRRHPQGGQVNIIFPSQFHPCVNTLILAAVNLNRSLYRTAHRKLNELFLAQANPPKPHSGEQVRCLLPGKVASRSPTSSTLADNKLTQSHGSSPQDRSKQPIPSNKLQVPDSIRVSTLCILLR